CRAPVPGAQARSRGGEAGGCRCSSAPKISVQERGPPRLGRAPVVVGLEGACVAGSGDALGVSVPAAFGVVLRRDHDVFAHGVQSLPAERAGVRRRLPAVRPAYRPPLGHAKSMTLRIPSCASISSNPRLTSSSVSLWETNE